MKKKKMAAALVNVFMVIASLHPWFYLVCPKWHPNTFFFIVHYF